MDYCRKSNSTRCELPLSFPSFSPLDANSKPIPIPPRLTHRRRHPTLLLSRFREFVPVPIDRRDIKPKQERHHEAQILRKGKVPPGAQMPTPAKGHIRSTLGLDCVVVQALDLVHEPVGRELGGVLAPDGLEMVKGVAGHLDVDAFLEEIGVALAVGDGRIGHDAAVADGLVVESDGLAVAAHEERALVSQAVDVHRHIPLRSILDDTQRFFPQPLHEIRPGHDVGNKPKESRDGVCRRYMEQRQFKGTDLGSLDTKLPEDCGSTLCDSRDVVVEICISAVVRVQCSL